MKFLETYLADCELRGLSPQTLETYRTYLTPFVGVMDSIVDKLGLLGYLRRYGNDRTKHVSYRTIKTFVRWMAAEGYCTDWVSSITYKLRPAAQEMPLSVDEFERIVKAIPTSSFCGRRDVALYSLYFYTGARREAIRSLIRPDINLKERIIHITTKGRKEQYLPLAQVAALRLNKWMLSCPPGPWIFPSVKHLDKPVDKGQVSAKLRDYATAAGIERRVHVHLLRHSCATAMVEAGISIDVVQAALGHSSIQMTQLYARMSHKRVADAFCQVFDKKEKVKK